MRFVALIKLFFKDKLVLVLSVFSLAFILATWWKVLSSQIEPDPITVLHYNIYAGFDMIGQWYWLYLIPAMVFIMSLINFLLAMLIWKRQTNWSYLLLTDDLLINAITFIFIFNILNYSF